MEALDILKAPGHVARHIGQQLLGGAWADMPALPQPDFIRPARILAVPENVILAEE